VLGARELLPHAAPKALLRLDLERLPLLAERLHAEHDAAAEDDLVADGELGACDAAAAEEGSVLRAEILDPQPPACEEEAGVLARQGPVLDA
jgi:hypothetical protein